MNNSHDELKDFFIKINDQIIVPIKNITNHLQTTYAPKIIQFNQNFETYFKPFLIFFSELENDSKRLKKIESVGWLPHYTTPFHLLDDKESDYALNIENHYRDNWHSIRAQILDNLNLCNLEPETLVVLHEALEAHDRGMYRSVCRLIFPEIERLSRTKLYDEADFFESIASQRKLQQKLKTLPISYLSEMGGVPAISFFERLTNHLYINVKTMDSLKKIENDGIPNRHAAIHALVIYKTAQNSLNTIFLLDYLLRLHECISQEHLTADIT